MTILRRVGLCGRYDWYNTPDSLETFFHKLGKGPMLLNLGPPGRSPSYLEPGARYSVGGSPMVPAEHFDALIYLESSPKMTPLFSTSCH